MIGKLLCAVLSIALPAYALNVSDRTPVAKQVVSYPQVKQVDCDKGKGTAFQIADGRWVSVNHVTSLSGCKIDGHPIGSVAESDLDFSITDYAGPGKGFRVNCEGFIPGRYYFAIGYAGGFEWQTMSRHLATYQKTDDGFRILLGSPTVIPGMSGGVFLDEHGAAVATINMYSKIYPLSYGRELKDSSVCTK